MVPRLTIHKQKREVFAFSSILLCFFSFPPIFSRMIPRFLKSSNEKQREDIKRSNSSRSTWKRQQRPTILSVQLRKQERQLRQKQERKPRRKGLWRKKTRGNRQNIFNNFRIRYQWRILPFLRVLKDSNTRRSNGPLKRIRKNNY